MIYSPGLGITPLSSLYQCTRGGYVPDLERSGWLKYDEEKYIKILKQEAQKRQQVMQQQIIEQGILCRQSKTKKEEWSSLGCIYDVFGPLIGCQHEVKEEIARPTYRSCCIK